MSALAAAVEESQEGQGGSRVTWPVVDRPAPRPPWLLVSVLVAGALGGCTRDNPDFDGQPEPIVRDLATGKGPGLDLALMGGLDLARGPGDLSTSLDLSTSVDLGGADHGTSGSCNDLYGSLPGFVLCEQTATTCRFSFGNETTKFSCAAACAGGMAACLSEWEVNGVSCDVGTNPLLTCSTLHHEVVCVCAR